MTQDAFVKAQQIQDDIYTVRELMGTFSNATLSSDADYYDSHNKYIIEAEAMLLFAVNSDSISSENATYDGKSLCVRGLVSSAKIPVDLADEIETVIRNYLNKLELEFAGLDGNWTDDSDN